MKNVIALLCISFLFLCGGNTVSRAQSSYIDLTLVSSRDYNKPLATFSHDVFEKAFKVSSGDGDVFEEDLNTALARFLTLLEPEESYIVQHEPTYYFVFQYNDEKGNYLVMNNSIGEKNQAIYSNTHEEAIHELMKLLLVFYSNTAVYNVTEYNAF